MYCSRTLSDLREDYADMSFLCYHGSVGGMGACRGM